MRIHLDLTLRRGSYLPFSYGYQLSSAIYNTLYNSSPEFAERLHDAGYTAANRNHKLFAFSPLRFAFDISHGGMVARGTSAQLQIGFLMPEALQHFIIGIFTDLTLRLAGRGFDTQLRVTLAHALPEPAFDNVMRYRLASPMFLKARRDDGSIQHLAPDTPDYGQHLAHNLRSKLTAAGQTIGTDTDIRFEILPGGFRSKLMHISGTDIKGYLFDFQLTAPLNAHRAGYYSGFGLEGSQGFGWTDIILQP